MLFEFDKMISTKKNETTLYSVDEGFLKGNLFKNLYDPYKNYEVKKIIPKTEKELLEYNIYKLCFAINDLNLYLDINPHDQEMYELFKKYIEQYKKYLHEYEMKYQVLELTDDTHGKYTWINNPWPWEVPYV